MSDSSIPFTPKFRRATWDDTWLGVARAVGGRSLCTRAQVGAVIVGRDQRILATGYNGPPRGFAHGDVGCSTGWCLRATAVDVEPDADYRDCPSLHAEANAISVSDYSSRAQGTLYVTSHICFTCAKLIANSGIIRVVVKSDGPRAYREPWKSYDLLKKCGVHPVVWG